MQDTPSVIVGSNNLPPKGLNGFWRRLHEWLRNLKPAHKIILLAIASVILLSALGLWAFFTFMPKPHPAPIVEAPQTAEQQPLQPADGASPEDPNKPTQEPPPASPAPQTSNTPSNNNNGGGSNGGDGSGGGGGGGSSDWPNADNTGRLASGCTSFQTVSSPSGYFNIGEAYDDQPFVQIQPDGTWLIECIITDSIFLVYQPKTTFRGVEISASPGENAAIQFRAEGTGGAHSGKVLYSTIHAINPTQQMQYAVLDMSSYGLQLKGNNFYWWSDAVQLGGHDILIEDNWMHDPVYYADDHTDAVQHFGGGQNVTIRHNRLTIDLTYMAGNGNQTAALALFQDGAAGENSYNNVLVENNLVGGGGYSFYCGYEKVKDPISNVRFINNKITTTIWPDGGFHGPKAAEPTWGQNGNQWTGNTWYDGPQAGATIPQ